MHNNTKTDIWCTALSLLLLCTVDRTPCCHSDQNNQNTFYILCCCKYKTDTRVITENILTINYNKTENK